MLEPAGGLCMVDSHCTRSRLFFECEKQRPLKGVLQLLLMVKSSLRELFTINNRSRPLPFLEPIVSTDNQELARSQYQAGKAAFERGAYRQAIELLEQASDSAGRETSLGGEAQIWLVTAYQAAGRQAEAVALCEALEQHADPKVRQQSRRLVYILKAPQLKLRPEWLTQIPDLTDLEDAEGEPVRARTGTTAPKAPRPPRPEPTPLDLSQVNTKDNGFLWLALIAIVLILGGLFWFSQ